MHCRYVCALYHSLAFVNISIDKMANTIKLWYLLFLQLDVLLNCENQSVSLSFLNLKGKSLPFSCSSFHVVCSTISHYATHQLKCMLSKTCRLHSKHSETYTSHTIYYLKMTHNKCGLFPFFWKRDTLKETVHMTLSRSH